MNPEDEDDLSWLLDETEPTPRGVTLDTVEIRGRADGDDSELREAERAAAARERGFDTTSDVAASIARKGRPADARDAPILADTLIAGAMHPLTEARSPEMNRATRDVTRARRDATDAFGSAFIDFAEPLVPDRMEASGTAGASGSAHGLTFGAIDELGGAGAELANLPDTVSGREGFGTAYRANRDRIRETGRRDREASPVAYGLGELAGAAATAPLIPTGPRAATMLGRLGGAAGEGAALGGFAGGFSSDADTAEDMLMDAAEGATGGAVFGAAGGLVGEGVDAGRRAMARSAARADELRAIAPAGGLAAGADAMRSAGEDVGDVARRMRAMGLGGVSTAEQAAERAAAARARYGSEIGDARRVLEDAAPVPVERIRGAMERHADTLGRTTSGAPLADSVRGRAERLRETMGEGTVPYSRAMEELEGLGRDLNWTTRAGRPVTSTAEAGRRLYGAVRGELDEIARPVLGEEGLAAYRNSRGNFRVASAADEAARAARDRVGSNRGVSLTDYATMLTAGGLGTAGGSTLGGLAAGAGAALANRAYRLREPSMRAATAEGVRALLESPGARALGTYAPVLRRALARGGDVFAGIHTALMRRDPEYAAAVEAATAAPPEAAPADDAWLEEFLVEEPPTTDGDDEWAEFLEESP
jgi:hypothetical protein